MSLASAAASFLQALQRQLIIFFDFQRLVASKHPVSFFFCSCKYCSLHHWEAVFCCCNKLILSPQNFFSGFSSLVCFLRLKKPSQSVSQSDLFIIDCFDLVLFAVDSAVSRTVKQRCTCGLMTCVSNWSGTALNV